MEDIKRVAAAYLKPTNRTSGLYIPTDKADRAPIPNVSDADIAAMVKGYKGDATVAAGEAFDPSPANIEARTARSKIGNLQVALLPKKTRGRSVVVRLSLQMGDEQSLMNRGLTGNVAGAMLMRGTVKRTRQQIRDELDKLKAYGSVSGEATGIGASFETTRENLPALMRLVAEIVRAPAFPASELEQLLQQALTNIESRRREPNAVAFNALSRHVNMHPKGDVRYVGTFDEQIAAYKTVTLDEVKAFHRDFYGAPNGQLTIVGDFDASEMAALAKELLGDWSSKAPYRRIASEYRDFAVVNKSFETPDKANAVFIAYQRLKVRDDDPDYPALLMAGNALAGDAYKNRLVDRLRQKEGVSYSAGGSISVGALDPVGSFVATATYAPQNAIRLEAAFKEEIVRALKDGFTAEELDGARKGWLQARSVARSQDGSLATRIHSLAFFDRTLVWDVALEERIKALTVADLNRALRRFVDLDKMIILKAGDFANAKREPAPGREGIMAAAARAGARGSTQAVRADRADGSGPREGPGRQDAQSRRSVRELQGGEEALVALEGRPRAEVAVEARVPVAQVDRPLLVKAERDARVPVGVAVVAAGDAIGVVAVIAPLLADEGAEGRREPPEPRERLRKPHLQCPHVASLVLVVGRVEHRHPERAVLPDLAAEPRLDLEVLVAEALVEGAEVVAGGVGIAVVDHAHIPGDVPVLAFDARVRVELQVGPGVVWPIALDNAPVEAGGKDAEVEPAARYVEPALDGRPLRGLREAAEDVVARERDVGRERAPSCLRLRWRRDHPAALGHSLGEYGTGEQRRPEKGNGRQTQSLCVCPDHRGFPASSSLYRVRV